MVKNSRGFALVGMLVTILILGLMYAQYFRSPGSNVGGGGEAPTPVESLNKAYDAVCKVNIMQINQALQMHAINHEPMQVLDVGKLSLSLQIPKGCPCQYSFDQNHKVVCSAHP